MRAHYSPFTQPICWPGGFQYASSLHKGWLIFPSECRSLYFVCQLPVATYTRSSRWMYCWPAGAKDRMTLLGLRHDKYLRVTINSQWRNITAGGGYRMDWFETSSLSIIYNEINISLLLHKLPCLKLLFLHLSLPILQTHLNENSVNLGPISWSFKL